ncbi:MAG: RNA-guided pseudouridylation complex pseudouridine synthase subunit Cbf5 [Halanaeroarchaeum sp.]
MTPLRDAPDERDAASLLEFGVVNLDKPPGPSAHQVSAWVRDMLDVEKAAHAGTLDPKVTGCLPVLTGAGTRLAPALLEGSKSYVAVLELHDDPPSDLSAVVEEFASEIYQKPPKKSAVARRLRTRTVHDLEVLEIADRQVLLDIRCESGTYVRKLCHHLGLAIGTGGHMGDLRRTGTDPFDDADLVTLHDLADALAVWREDDDPSWLRDVVDPAERALTHLPSVTIAPSAAAQVAEGAPVYAPGILEADDAPEDALVACYTPNGSAVCLGRVTGDLAGDAGEAITLERVLV